VCEAGRGQVKAFDVETGQAVLTWGGLAVPSGVVAAGQQLFVASAGSHAVFARDLRCEEAVRVVAGQPGTAGNMKSDDCGDGGPATSARLYSPMALAFDAADQLLVADAYNGRVRSVSNGIIQTIAGADQSAPRGNRGQATEINIGQPRGIAVAPDGPFVATTPGMIWQLRAGEMCPTAGTWVDGCNGSEGDATDMRLNVPHGVAFFAGGLAIADSDNHRVCCGRPAKSPPTCGAARRQGRPSKWTCDSRTGRSMASLRSTRRLPGFESMIYQTWAAIDCRFVAQVHAESAQEGSTADFDDHFPSHSLRTFGQLLAYATRGLPLAGHWGS
ncbi:unnamed protein product, partial [Polarella glacialis]